MKKIKIYEVEPDNYCLSQEYYNDIKDDLTIIRGNIGFREHKSQLYRESVEIIAAAHDRLGAGPLEIYRISGYTRITEYHPAETFS